MEEKRGEDWREERGDEGRIVEEKSEDDWRGEERGGLKKRREGRIGEERRRLERGEHWRDDL